MKPSLNLILCVIIACFNASCSKSDNERCPEEELYQHVMEISNSYRDILPELSLESDVETKCENEGEAGWVLFSELPKDIQALFLSYFSPSDFNTWDEMDFCVNLLACKSISDTEKEATAHSLAACVALKSILDDEVVTKGGHPESDCRSIYYSKVRQAMFRVIGLTFAGLAGGILGAEAACAASLTQAVTDIQDAGVEYVRCWA